MSPSRLFRFAIWFIRLVHLLCKTSVAEQTKRQHFLRTPRRREDHGLEGMFAWEDDFLDSAPFWSCVVTVRTSSVLDFERRRLSDPALPPRFGD